MRTIIETLAAGVPSVYNIAGSHLEILSAEFPVSVSIQDANGVEITNGKSENILAGTYFVPRQGFDRFTITSANAQQVTIGVSFGESGTRRVAGTVTIAGTPSVNVANPDAQKRYEEYGASFKSFSSLAANVAEQVVSPAANVNGVLLWSAEFTGYVESISTVVGLVAKTSAPASVVDGDVISLAEGSLSGIYQYSNGILRRPIKIAAGKGIYFIASSGLQYAPYRSVLYTIL